MRAPEVLRCRSQAAISDAANNPLLGLINIVPQILVILATMVAFYRLDRMAGWCLAPLAAWVSFPTVLNVAISKLNP